MSRNFPADVSIAAQSFPEARVLGTDLSPIQPTQQAEHPVALLPLGPKLILRRSIPANCHFEIDDAEDEWIFGHKFDYIHGRALASCFEDPSFVIKQAFEACSPGGYLELQDAAYPFRFAGNPEPNSALRRWADLLCLGAAQAGRPLTNAQHYKRWMEEAGFEDVVELRFYWPNGPWAKGEYYKTLGIMFQENLLAGLHGISLRVLTVLGWVTDQITPFLAEVEREIKEASVHAFLPM
jgi:SAM-dependent methyltransferase